MKKMKIIVLTILVALSLGACGTSKVDKAIEQGNDLFENHEYEEALSYFNQAMDAGSTSLQVEDSIMLIEAYEKAQRLFKKEEYYEAEEVLEKINFNYEDYAISDDIDDLKESIANEINGEGSSEIKEEGKDDEEKAEVSDSGTPEDFWGSDNIEDFDNFPGAVDDDEVVDDFIVDDFMEQDEPGNFSRKSVYLNKIDQTQRNASGKTPAESYVLWDNLLNEIWGVLKGEMSEQQMDQLLTEQRQWIKDKEAAGNQPVLTERRCKELVEWHMR